MEGNIEEFCWGTKECLIKEPYLLIDKLIIKLGGFSSIHYHKHQYNQMIVLNGILFIEYYNGSKLLIKDKLITGFVSNRISPYSSHRFKADQNNTTLIEIITSSD